MDQTADLLLRWHLVGHLQSNKAKKAGARFDLIHSVDSVDLLSRIDEAAAAAGRRIDVLVQVDLAGEATKHGAPAEELAPVFAAARDGRAVRLVGLMLLPPAVDDPDAARPFFRALRGVRDRLMAARVDPLIVAPLCIGM